MIYLHVYQNQEDVKQQSKKLLYKNLSAYLQQEINENDVTYNPNGKPTVEGLHYSVSHSKHVVVQAFAHTQVLGVDVEYINRERNYMALAKRYYHPREFLLMESLVPEHACRLFYTLWSLKEAVCKAEGGRLWYYLSGNYLDHNQQLLKEMNGMALTIINDTEGFSLALASYENTEIKVVS